MRKIILLALLTSALPAAARVLPSTSVHVLLDGHREPGVGLHGDARGWRLPITPDRGATDVVLVDETSPTRDKWILPLDGRAIFLEAGRFVGGHAYRVEVRRGTEIVERGLVYLYPSRAGRRAQVTFDVGDGAVGSAAGNGGGISLLPKSAL